MPTTKSKSAPPKSRILAEVHEFASDLHKRGHISAKKMRRFDDLSQPGKAATPADLQISLTLKPAVAAVFPTAKAATEALESLARMIGPIQHHRRAVG